MSSLTTYRRSKRIISTSPALLVTILMIVGLSGSLTSCGGGQAASGSGSNGSGSGSGSGSGGSGPSDSGVTITSQPKSAAVTFGQPATFSVKATGTAPLSYQ